MSEWKPGDVAMVRNEYGAWNRAILQVGFPRSRWQYGVVEQSAGVDREARPLAVIDPEDREEVERFRGIASRWADQVPYSDMRKAGDMDHADAMQAALREFASPKPPKPEEPKRYLSVVRLADGRRYWRWSAGDAHTGHPWRLLGAVHADTEDDGNFRWPDLDVVEVESDGIEAS